MTDQKGAAVSDVGAVQERKPAQFYRIVIGAAAGAFIFYALRLIPIPRFLSPYPDAMNMLYFQWAWPLSNALLGSAEKLEPAALTARAHLVYYTGYLAFAVLGGLAAPFTLRIARLQKPVRVPLHQSEKVESKETVTDGERAEQSFNFGRAVIAFLPWLIFEFVLMKQGVLRAEITHQMGDPIFLLLLIPLNIYLFIAGGRRKKNQ